MGAPLGRLPVIKSSDLQMGCISNSADSYIAGEIAEKG